MIKQIGRSSPSSQAKIGGVLYLLTILTRMFVEIFVRNRLVVPDDAAATATNIMANEPLWRLGFVGDIIAFASYVALTAIFYELFKLVNRSICLVAVYFSLVACAAQAISSLFHLAPLVLLGRTPYLSVFNAEQLQALTLMFLRLRALCYHNVGLVFFGLYLLLTGYLIFRSTFLPRIIGVLMILAGLSYEVFVSPPLALSLQPYVLFFPGVAQISLTFWLLVMGVNDARWNGRVSAAE